MPTKTTTYRSLRPSALAAMATVAMVVAAGCSGETGSPPDLGQPIPTESPASPTGSQASDAPTSSETPRDAQPEGSAEPISDESTSEPLGAPIALEFAGERSSVVSVGADQAAALDIPGDLDTLGWWQDGAEPGAPEGFVVITGHATQDGSAAANAWWEAEPGDQIVVETEQGTAKYQVTSRQTYAYEEVPLARWFPASGPSGPAGLALITCADYYDGEWHSNLVVEAVPE